MPRAALLFTGVLAFALLPLPTADAAVHTVWARGDCTSGGSGVVCTNVRFEPATISILAHDSVVLRSEPHVCPGIDGETYTYHVAGAYGLGCGPPCPTPCWISVSVDVRGPTLRWHNLCDGCQLFGNQTWRGNATYAGAGVTRVDIRANASAWQPTVFDGHDWSYPVDTRTFPNGNLTITARATGSDGVQTFRSVSVKVANAPFVDVAVGPLTSITGTTGPARVQFTETNLGNVVAGFHTLRLEILDTDGVWKTAQTLTVSGPGARLAEPREMSAPHAFHAGTFQARVTSDPPNVLRDADRSNNVGTGTVSFFTDDVEGINLLDPLASV